MPQRSKQRGRAPQKRRTTHTREEKKQPTANRGRSAMADLQYLTPIFPITTRRKLMYHDMATITSTAGAVGRYFFSANGMFDPNITGTGHQPLGFDQLMLLYEQATVISSKISVVFINNATGFYTRCAVSLCPDTTALSDKDEIMENGLIRSVILSPISVAGSCKTISLNCSIASYFGRRRSARELLDDVNLITTVAVNPTEQVYFCLNVWDPTAANTATVAFEVVLEFDAIFWEPRKLAVS